MALRQATKALPLVSNAIKVSIPKCNYITSSLHDDPYQYTNDGEKIYCGYRVNKQGTKEELGDVVESARAKAFDDSLNNVIHVKYDDNRDNQ